jgi:type VI secretion system protein ImpJ
MHPRKPHWPDGALLFPQLFEAQDRYHEDLLSFRLSLASTQTWGVRELEIDRDALRAGHFRVTRLAAVMRDGTPLLVDGAHDDVLPGRAIDLAANVSTLDVHVAVTSAVEGIASLAKDDDPTSLARYVRAERRMLDAATGRDERVVESLRHNLRLVFGDEPMDRAETLPVARLVRNASGAFDLSPTYVPPVTRIGAAPQVMAMLERLQSTLITKTHSLRAGMRQRSASLADVQAADAARFWLLFIVNGAIPIVRDLLKRPETPPVDAHRWLAHIYGQLCTFDPSRDVTRIPTFLFMAQGETFAELEKGIADLLNTVVADRFRVVPLVAVHPQDPYHLIAELRDSSLYGMEFFLAASGAPGTEAHWVAQVPPNVKLGPPALIENLKRSAVMGIRLQPEATAPAVLPAKPGVVFFRIDRQNPLWVQAVSAQRLGLFQPFPSGVQFTLYAVDPSALAGGA